MLGRPCDPRTIQESFLAKFLSLELGGAAATGSWVGGATEAWEGL